MKQVIVASRNPVKIEAVKSGFLKLFPSEAFSFEGLSVPSGVNDQPMTDEETLRGAENRAQNAKKKIPNAHYWVGVEGGIEKAGDGMTAFAWIVIASDTKIGKAKTGSFFLPQEVVKLIGQGMELGHADDVVFGKSNSKQEGGAVGLLTGNVMTRATLYSEAVILALIPFKNPHLYS